MNQIIICNLNTGAHLGPDAVWTMIKQLRNSLIHLLGEGSITDEVERQKLEYLIKTKK